MSKWLGGKKKHEEERLTYSELRLIPSRGLPHELAEQEASVSFASQREAHELELLERARRIPHDAPLFTELLGAKDETFLTINLPNNGGVCLPVFSSPLRAMDYAQTLLPDGFSFRYLCSSPQELTKMLRDLEEAGVKAFTIDRCPRCKSFASINIDSNKTVDDLLDLLAVFKATELARADLYFTFARDSALAGHLEVALDVALETVGHVTLEDPRPHLLLGHLGVELRDERLVQEAQAFLRFLKFEEWEQELEDAVRTGSPDFEFPR